MNDLVSAIIVTYKRPIEILRRAIDSVLHQTYTNIEIIIVNDAPEEKELCNSISKLVLNYHNDSIILLVHKKNKGANAARNTGLHACKGKYVCFLDDDDEWLPDKIENQLYLARNGFALIYGPFIFRDERGDSICKIVEHKEAKKDILQGNFIGSTSFPMILKSAIDRVGGFDESLISCQEYDLWLRIIYEFPIAFIDKTLGVYYYSNDSTFKKPTKYILGIESIVEKHKDLYSQFPRQYSNRLINLSFELLKKRRFFSFTKYKWKAFVVDKLNPNNITLIFLMRRYLKER